jgi:aspartyl-tRNA(Asn)/glutamyl-tRNA(Gln) amidotransferase subunit C
MPINLSPELVRYITLLAKLRLTEEQVATYDRDLSAIVGYMQELQQLDLSQTAETARVNSELNVLREDKVEDSLSQSQALQNASRTHAGYFVVPYIFTETL